MKDADQLHAFVFAYAKSRFSHDAALMYFDIVCTFQVSSKLTIWFVANALQKFMKLDKADIKAAAEPLDATVCQ